MFCFQMETLSELRIQKSSLSHSDTIDGKKIFSKNCDLLWNLELVCSVLCNSMGRSISLKNITSKIIRLSNFKDFKNDIVLDTSVSETSFHNLFRDEVGIYVEGNSEINSWQSFSVNGFLTTPVEKGSRKWFVNYQQRRLR